MQTKITPLERSSNNFNSTQWSAVFLHVRQHKVSYFKNALLFGDQNFSSGDHFTKGSRQKATSEKLELGALNHGGF